MGAAVALTPRVRIMVICDAVRKSKIEADVFNLKASGRPSRRKRFRSLHRFGFSCSCLVPARAFFQHTSASSTKGPIELCFRAI
jgi:hypothetical protein